ncbi:C40 family peptidase [Novosphingobium lentum]|uniref:C40 family peptidase n=1 Tax=Novosphingobium lentum TaxID=145287 RepID=UPI001FE2060D|nr:C40 family peptidase [Novosphingobium lentum]
MNDTTAGTGGSPATRPYAGQYMLSGPAKVRDPRVTPIRGDLGDIALAGKLFAPHYVVPMERAVAVDHIALRKAKGDGAEQVSELLRGERFCLLDIAGGWGWGYGKHDHYLGYLPMEALADPADVPAPAAPDHADPVALAEALASTPYVWGGRGGAGIDCSGLVQTVFARAGIVLPRDSDQQRDADVGRLLDDSEPGQRGDLVFLPGHVGILKDADTVIHASQDLARVAIEPLADMVARKGTAITARRRVL